MNQVSLQDVSSGWAGALNRFISAKPRVVWFEGGSQASRRLGSRFIARALN